MERGKVKTLCRLTLSLKIKMNVRKVRFNLRKATALYLITFFGTFFAILSHHIQQQRGRNVKFKGTDILQCNCRHTEFDSFLCCDRVVCF